jgi:hypothetical protein
MYRSGTVPALVAPDCAVDTSTPAGEVMAHVLATFGQFERRLIAQRTKEALAAKKASGVRLGRLPTVPQSRERGPGPDCPRVASSGTQRPCVASSPAPPEPRDNALLRPQETLRSRGRDWRGGRDRAARTVGDSESGLEGGCVPRECVRCVNELMEHGGEARAVARRARVLDRVPDA